MVVFLHEMLLKVPTPFDLVMEALWFGCTELLDPEQFSWSPK